MSYVNGGSTYHINLNRATELTTEPLDPAYLDVLQLERPLLNQTISKGLTSTTLR